MKKKILLTLMVIMLSLIAIGTISASAETDGYYTYSVLNGEATITDCDTSISGDVTIPSTLGGYPVTSIGSFAFRYCTGLTGITIPDSVTSIGEYAFYYCTGLTSIGVSENNQYYTSVDGVLFNKDKTTLIRYPVGKSNTSYTIPDSVTSIGSSAFHNCTGLTSITIPDSVTSIGDFAFDGCTDLTSVTIGNGVTSIGNYAFYDCKGLTSITIPDSVTSIGNYAFDGCTGLTKVNITDISAWCNIYFYSFDTNPLCYAKKLYLNNELVTDLVIPDNVTEIKDYAFYYCTGLTSITIPDSVTSIGGYAFYDCQGLTSVTIGNGVTSIGNYAFYNCSGITSIGVSENNQYYTSVDGVLFNKDKTTLIRYPVGKSNTSYTIPDSVTSIGDFAFDGCTGLTSITIPDSVTSIGDFAFDGCTDLTSVTIGNGVTSIGNYAFYDCKGLTSITIPDSVTSIGGYAFGYCSSLTSITIPNSVTSIGEYAFYYCKGLTSVYYNGTEEEWNNVSIGSNNTALTNATIYYTEVFEISDTAKELAGGEKMVIRDEVTGVLKEVDAVLGENDKVIAIFAKNVTDTILEAGKYGIIFKGIKFSGKGNVEAGKAWSIKLIGPVDILPSGSYPYSIYASDTVVEAKNPFVID